MSDLFDAFESSSAPTNENLFDAAADPAAAFLAKEEAELAKIENNEFLGTDIAASDPFESFGLLFYFFK